MKTFLILFFFISLSLTSKAEDLMTIGIGVGFSGEDKGMNFDPEGADITDISGGIELAYIFEMDNNLGIGPLLSNRTRLRTAEWDSGLLEFSYGVRATHNILGATSRYYFQDRYGFGFFGRADLGLGFATYATTDGDGEPTELNDDIDATGQGIAGSLGFGYGIELGTSTALDFQLLYSFFPINVDVEGDVDINDYSEGASYVTLMVAISF